MHTPQTNWADPLWLYLSLAAAILLLGLLVRAADRALQSAARCDEIEAAWSQIVRNYARSEFEPGVDDGDGR